jgi:uncharacterized membrane protein YgcG
MKNWLPIALLPLLVPGLLAQQGGKPATPPAGEAKQAPPAAGAKPAPPAGDARQATPAGTTTFSKEQLEQIAAPIALYPDALLMQVMMASTYPLEVVEAARWVAAKGKMDTKALEAALQKESWDPSVKSLCPLPDVLKRMSDNLDWTQDLGDAFLGQQAALMDAVQTLRRHAYEAGNLKTSKELKVTDNAEKIIVIESTKPEVVYVPTYYPSAVYGAWTYPTWYYPPMYVPPPAGAYLIGVGIGVAWACHWGHCHWGHGHTHVDVHVEHHNNFVDRTESGARRDEVKAKAKDGNWKHDPTHRKGAPYRDAATASQFGGQAGQKRISRDQARGYDRAGTRPAAGTGAARPGTQPSRPSSSTRPSTPTTRPSGSSKPKASTGKTSSSLTGSNNARNERAASQRGSTSRSSAGSRGASRSSGGGSRGGGGMRGGGGRR